MTVRKLKAHPGPIGGDLDAVVGCIEACADCAAACTSCADADLGEERPAGDGPLHPACCLDCADLCGTTRPDRDPPDRDRRRCRPRSGREPAWWPAAPVARSASAMPSTMSTAASAPRCAAAASRPARNCSRRSADRAPSSADFSRRRQAVPRTAHAVALSVNWPAGSPRPLKSSVRSCSLLARIELRQE